LYVFLTIEGTQSILRGAKRVVRVIKKLEEGDWRKKMEAKRKRERGLKNI